MKLMTDCGKKAECRLCGDGRLAMEIDMVGFDESGRPLVVYVAGEAFDIGPAGGGSVLFVSRSKGVGFVRKIVDVAVK